jgi:hypothetical protein
MIITNFVTGNRHNYDYEHTPRTLILSEEHVIHKRINTAAATVIIQPFPGSHSIQMNECSLWTHKRTRVRQLADLNAVVLA